MLKSVTSPNTIVVLAAALLIASLFYVRRLAAELPPGVLRRRWRRLALVIFFIIAGYVAYVSGATEKAARLSVLLVPMIFFLGSCIVLVVCMMSLQTARDVRRIASLEIQTLMDPLTGVYNRRYLNDRFRIEISRALRYGFPLSVLMIDVDHFKQVNDVWGHQVGDTVLTALGRLLRSSVRPQDVTARYGGEEFVILAPDTAMPGAVELAARLHQAVMDTVLLEDLNLTSGEGLRLTVSIGVAALEREGDDAQKLLARADAAMYQAKREGRNRVASLTNAAPRRGSGEQDGVSSASGANR